MEIKDFKFNDTDFAGKGISNMPTIPGENGYSTQQVKDAFDQIPKVVMAMGKLNAFFDFLKTFNAGEEIGVMDVKNGIETTVFKEFERIEDEKITKEQNNARFVQFLDGETFQTKYDRGELRGLAGERGEQGLQGIQGTQGKQGLQGEQGPQGEQGLQGLVGSHGVAGQTGAQGARGAQGEQGEQGIQGLQGVQGVRGEKGEKGDRGIDGVITEISGMYTFFIENGILKIKYQDGGEPPPFRIDEQGDLIYEY